MSGKISVLELEANMLFTNQIERFIRIKYLMKEVKDGVYFWHAHKHQVSHKLILKF